MSGYVLLRGDCRERMALLDEASVDAIVCDPPYELGFMGKGWDSTGIANDPAMWRQALRVLKPGGHLLAFGGTRTFHRMACAIEDAGFDLRDCVANAHEDGTVEVNVRDCPWLMAWVYGSGFPKSLDVSKAIDKAAGAERKFEPVGNAVKRMIPGADQDATGSWIKDNGREYQPGVSEPATEAARQWQGWGTALKPAWEPIVVARKPLIGTVAANVLAHGTGAINVDGCRVPGDVPQVIQGGQRSSGGIMNANGGERGTLSQPHDLGRWPANIIHDGSDEVLAAFPQAPGQLADASSSSSSRKDQNVYGAMTRGSGGGEARQELDKSAARFFYCAKASKRDRGDDNIHPTVKPTELMRYLCRLVTPPGGLILDPFTGSGSTGKAAVLEGFNFIGCELSDEYADIAELRIGSALFGDLA